MTSKYEEMREALIALLCVGDKIKRIHGIPDDYNSKTRSYNHHWEIRSSYVEEITDNDIKIRTSNTADSNTLKYIEAYKGELYFWGNIDCFPVPKRENKITQIMKIVESKDTIHVS